MSKQLIQHYMDFSFLKNFFFGIKVNRALKACNKIEAYLLSKKYLSNLDSRLKLVISDGINNDTANSYFLYKGYNIDGSIKEMKKFTIIKEEIMEYVNVLSRDIIILDLGDKSIYLHNYSKNSRSMLAIPLFYNRTLMCELHSLVYTLNSSFSSFWLGDFQLPSPQVG